MSVFRKQRLYCELRKKDQYLNMSFCIWWTIQVESGTNYCCPKWWEYKIFSFICCSKIWKRITQYIIVRNWNHRRCACKILFIKLWLSLFIFLFQDNIWREFTYCILRMSNRIMLQYKLDDSDDAGGERIFCFLRTMNVPKRVGIVITMIAVRVFITSQQ